MKTYKLIKRYPGSLELDAALLHGSTIAMINTSASTIIEEYYA